MGVIWFLYYDVSLNDSLLGTDFNSQVRVLNQLGPNLPSPARIIDTKGLC